ncbi:MAG: hypothetical protein LBT30_07765 [Clostridiales bacterium]|jgi:hypothetical protein|nr:hypothetical protein [Clostridiales bacterium]
MITQKLCQYKSFGKCAELTDGRTKALITLDVGPRIIYYGTDERNVFFEDTDGLVTNGGEYFDKNFKKGEAWHIYGGHRMWKSPEDDASYVPDNYPVEYAPFKDGAEFTQKLQPNTKLIFSMKVTMKDGGGLTVVHAVKNAGKYTANISVWSITVMKDGGTEIIPLNTADTGFLPNNFFAYWAYNDVNDKRLTALDGYLFLKQDPSAARPFKLGLLNKKGAAAYLTDGLLFVKKFGYINGAVYPDNNCNFETYTSNLILEIETLSPLFAVEPGTQVTHTEEFSLFADTGIFAEAFDKQTLDAFFG